MDRPNLGSDIRIPLISKMKRQKDHQAAQEKLWARHHPTGVPSGYGLKIALPAFLDSKPVFHCLKNSVHSCRRTSTCVIDALKKIFLSDLIQNVHRGCKTADEEEVVKIYKN